MQPPPPIGTILTNPEHRDAIHIAIAPVVAAQRLFPAQRIGILEDGRASPKASSTIGIVDPFLALDVEEGQRFFLFLDPGTITTLRHNWTHPAFEEKPPDKAASEAWLRNFIDNSNCPDYNTVINAAAGDHYLNSREEGEDENEEGYVFTSNDGEYLHFNSWDAHGDIPPEFWDHIEIVTGRRIGPGLRAKHFSCSC